MEFAGPEAIDRRARAIRAAQRERPGELLMESLLLLAANSQAMQDLSTFHPASPPAESIRSLAILLLAITGFIFIVVEGVLIYSLPPLWHDGSTGLTEPTQA